MISLLFSKPELYASLVVYSTPSLYKNNEHTYYFPRTDEMAEIFKGTTNSVY